MAKEFTPFQLNQRQLYPKLRSLAAEMQNRHLRDLFQQDPQRAQRFSLEACELFLDYSKNLIDEACLHALLGLCEEAGLKQRIEQLFSGDKINTTENRAVLHTALRDMEGRPIKVDGVDVSQEIVATRDKIRDFMSNIEQQKLLGYSGKPIDTLVSIGIGGSYLGPNLVCEALEPFRKPHRRCYFVANIDGTDISRTLSRINPETTLFLIQSKTFTTLETLSNAHYARQWMSEQGMPESATSLHFMAVTAHTEAAMEFGISKDNIFPMWDWVGGRYSLWSAIGFSIAFSIGFDGYQELLQGAHEMDQHFRTSSFDNNLPVVLAVLGVWYNNFFDANSHAILVYDEYLKNLTTHLQQLDMESNGKGVTLNGSSLHEVAGPVIWGGHGCNSQHSFHQLLHQGLQLIPADFIVPLKSHHPVGEQHLALFANCLSQSRALMQGKTLDEVIAELRDAGLAEEDVLSLAPHKTLPGNHPSNTLIMKQVTPHSLGALIAMYEHKVFVQGCLWGINSFDQWGVELGKEIGKAVISRLKYQSDTPFDSSTESLISRFQTEE